VDTITKKIAAYVFTSSGPNDKFIMFRSDDNIPDNEYLRVSEFIEVSLPKITIENLIQLQVDAIDSEIDKIKTEAMTKVNMLERDKQELLALEHHDA
jgi:hypothetical protein